MNNYMIYNMNFRATIDVARDIDLVYVRIESPSLVHEFECLTNCQRHEVID